MEPAKRKIRLEKAASKYKSMDVVKKTDILPKNAEKYKSMDPIKKDISTSKNPLIHDIDYYISRFHNKINEGHYICSVCNRLLYRKSVLLQKHVHETLFTDIKSFDDKEYICKTCHSKVLKGKLHCQAIYNNMYVDKIPAELASLIKLEQILIAQRIVSVLPDYPVAIQSIKNCSLGNKVFNIAPGENRHPVSIMTDKKCEELAFPAFFPKGSLASLKIERLNYHQ